MSASEGGAAPARPASASEINLGGSLLLALKGLWPYLWPVDWADLRAGVKWKSALPLVLAKIATMTTPFFFKWATGCGGGGRGSPYLYRCDQPDHRRAADADAGVGLLPHRDGRVVAVGRRPVRQGGDPCGAAPCARDLQRAYGRVLSTAFTSSVDRRSDAYPRAAWREGIDTRVRMLVRRSRPDDPGIFAMVNVKRVLQFGLASPWSPRWV